MRSLEALRFKRFKLTKLLKYSISRFTKFVTILYLQSHCIKTTSF